MGRDYGKASDKKQNVRLTCWGGQPRATQDYFGPPPGPGGDFFVAWCPGLLQFWKLQMGPPTILRPASFDYPHFGKEIPKRNTNGKGQGEKAAPPLVGVMVMAEILALTSFLRFNQNFGIINDNFIIPMGSNGIDDRETEKKRMQATHKHALPCNFKTLQ